MTTRGKTFLLLTTLGLSPSCSLGLDFDDCSSDAQCPDNGVCIDGRCEAPAGGTQSDTCPPGATVPCVCDDDALGVQTCAANGEFGVCDCRTGGTGGDQTTGTDDEGDGIGDESGMDDETTGATAECAFPSDCPTDPAPCFATACNAGQCVEEPMAEGTPCGSDETTSCDGIDLCDGAGVCQTNVLADGAGCQDCGLAPGQCACSAGVCATCPGFAAINSFSGPESLAGWTMTGGWQLYYATPETNDQLPVQFSGLVLGTDGNRVEPYPGIEAETSTLTSPAFVLSDFLEFRSWHVDEGGAIPVGAQFADDRTIRLSTDDGETWTVLAQCAGDDSWPFCGEVTQRDANAWDDVLIPVPKELVGEVGIVEFAYDTLDECCGAEQGWYIDETNFGTRCACAEDTECAGYDSECGLGDCAPTGDCRVIANNEGGACGDAQDTECIAADSCNAAGVCATNDPPNWTLGCALCDAGPGQCGTCLAGDCQDCADIQPSTNFEDQRSMQGWLLTGDWARYSAAPANTFGDPAIAFSTESALGTDGNLVAPYGAAAHAETSSATSPLFILGDAVTFDSWHLDEGGATTPAYDGKVIEVSVDDQMSWDVLVDCATQPPDAMQPFCEPIDERLGDDWDAISLDTTAYSGQAGRVRFRYDTIDANDGSDRGWYIDNTSFPYCADAPPAAGPG